VTRARPRVPGCGDGPRPERRRLPLLLRRAWYGLNQAFRRRIAHLGAGEGRLERARHLEPDGWHDDAVGNLAADLLHGNLKTLRRLHAPAKPDGTHLEARDGQPGHADELVGRLKGIEDGRQAKIEDVIQCQHMYAHGKYNIKYGITATSPVRATALFSVVGRAGSGPRGEIAC